MPAKLGLTRGDVSDCGRYLVDDADRSTEVDDPAVYQPTLFGSTERGTSVRRPHDKASALRPNDSVSALPRGSSALGSGFGAAAGRLHGLAEESHLPVSEGTQSARESGGEYLHSEIHEIKPISPSMRVRFILAMLGFAVAFIGGFGSAEFLMRGRKFCALLCLITGVCLGFAGTYLFYIG